MQIIKKPQRGEITTLLVLIGIGIMALGIVAGKKIVEKGTNFLPKAQTVNPLDTEEVDVAVPGTIYDENYPHITYSPVSAWERVTNQDARHDHFQRSNTIDSTATFKIKGDKMDLKLRRSPSSGKAGIYIDGNLQHIEDLFVSSNADFKKYTYNMPTSGRHNIKIQVRQNTSSTDHYVGLDYFEVKVNLTATPTPTPSPTVTSTPTPTTTPSTTPTSTPLRINGWVNAPYPNSTVAYYLWGPIHCSQQNTAYSSQVNVSDSTWSCSNDFPTFQSIDQLLVGSNVSRTLTPPEGYSCTSWNEKQKNLNGYYYPQIYNGNGCIASFLILEGENPELTFYADQILIPTPSPTVTLTPTPTRTPTPTTTTSPTPLPTPVNDTFNNAQLIQGSTGQVTSSNIGATKEIGEPTIHSTNGGKSVWFHWFSPSSERVTVTFDTIGSEIDTLLGVYTGSSVSALSLVADNDDYPGLNYRSKVIFDTDVNRDYKIAVDGYHGNSGIIKLNWSAALITISPSASMTPTPTSTAAPTPTLTPTPSQTPTPTPTLTPTVTLTPTATFTPSPTPDLRIGLIMYYKLDEPNFINDCLTKTITNYATNTVDGLVCPAGGGPEPYNTNFINLYSYLFNDARKDRIEVPDQQIPSRNGTVSFWVFPLYHGPSDVIRSGVIHNEFRFIFNPEIGVVLAGFNINGEYGVSPGMGAAPGYGDWSLLSLTWDQTNGTKYYLNKEFIAGNPNPPPAFLFTGFKIGNDPLALEPYKFRGYLADLRIYNKALSADEIAALYFQVISPTPTSTPIPSATPTTTPTPTITLTPTASPSPTPICPNGPNGDLNCDTVVNAIDISIMINHWDDSSICLTPTPPFATPTFMIGQQYTADIANNCNVNTWDLNQLLTGWSN